MLAMVEQYQEYDAKRAASARGMTAGVGAAYHVLPFEKWDPWFQISTGYRVIWENPVEGATTPSVTTHGPEVARLQIGVDQRVSRDLAFSPAVGVDLTVPLWQTVGAASGAIADPRPSAYIYAGLGVRFDVTSKFVRRGAPPSAPPQVTQARIASPPPPAKPVSPALSMSDEVLSACKLAFDNADTAPKFDFDKSTLMPADLEALNKIAECLTTGPLKNDNVRLVGRADPRGSVAYNDALGFRRAESVAQFLVRRGVHDARIERASRGERDATGTDEASWARDRRVDVVRIEIRLERR